MCVCVCSNFVYNKSTQFHRRFTYHQNRKQLFYKTTTNTNTTFLYVIFNIQNCQSCHVACIILVKISIRQIWNFFFIHTSNLQSPSDFDLGFFGKNDFANFRQMQNMLVPYTPSTLTLHMIIKTNNIHRFPIQQNFIKTVRLTREKTREWPKAIVDPSGEKYFPKTFHHFHAK